MAELIDARGLSCPQPVLLFLTAAKKNPDGDFTVLVDNEASRENVSRAARNSGFTAESTEDGADFRIEIRK